MDFITLPKGWVIRQTIDSLIVLTKIKDKITLCKSYGWDGNSNVTLPPFYTFCPINHSYKGLTHGRLPGLASKATTTETPAFELR